MQIQGLKEQQELLAKAIDAKVAVLLVGPTGSGKTTMVHHLARERKTELVSIPLHGQIGRLTIANLSDHHNIRVLTQNRT